MKNWPGSSTAIAKLYTFLLHLSPAPSSTLQKRERSCPYCGDVYECEEACRLGITSGLEHFEPPPPPPCLHTAREGSLSNIKLLDLLSAFSTDLTTLIRSRAYTCAIHHTIMDKQKFSQAGRSQVDILIKRFKDLGHYDEMYNNVMQKCESDVIRYLTRRHRSRD